MEGNQMETRGALAKIRDMIMGGGFDGRSPAHIVNICDAALSAPPRNCDVGTAEEQGERCLAEFDQWRRKGDGKKLITAIMTWAQMPYEAREISRAHRAGEKTTNQTTRNNNEQ